MIFRRRGQSILEYSILLVLVIAAFLVMKDYIKRGFQGRWKAAVDDLGDQYDPYKSEGGTTYRMTQESRTQIRVIPDTVEGVPGFYTLRNDSSDSSETRDGMLTTTP